MLIALFTSIAISMPSPARVAPVRPALLSFAQVVRWADVIGIGTVERIYEVEGDPRHEAWWRETPRVRIAEVAARAAFKGAAEQEKFLFITQPTGSCETTSVTEGERAFFFLQRNPKFFAARSEVFDTALRKQFGTREVFQLVGSGDGWMPISDGQVYAGLAFPMEFVKAQRPEANHEFLTYALLGPFEELLTRTLREQDRPWISASASALGSSYPWELQIRYDRKSELVVHSPSGTTRKQFSIPWVELVQLSERIRINPCDPLPAEVGKRGPSGPQRRIAVAPTFETTMFELDEETLGDPEKGGAVQCALALWEDVRALLPDSALAGGKNERR